MHGEQPHDGQTNRVRAFWIPRGEQAAFLIVKEGRHASACNQPIDERRRAR